MNTSHSPLRFILRVCLAASVLAAIALPFFFTAPARSAGETATVTFRKIFKTSYP
jgi:hypothetical protein